ncbi:hypothetical protein VI817_000006 [Penicillium citrinum]|nr:hypothetical protein VI817_000006 [Penicillium citrinum]
MVYIPSYLFCLSKAFTLALNLFKMDAWSTKYLQNWAHDFKEEPNNKQTLKYLEKVMSELKNLSDSKSTNKTTTSPSAVALSILNCIKSQQNPEIALEDLQALVFEAAIESPLSAMDLAEFMQSLLDNLSGPLGKKFKLQLASNTRERWNGPEKPSSSKGLDQCIEEWVSLNTFVAHLSRTYTVPLEDYALRTFNRAFGPGVDLDEKVYHIPAAAAWMDIMGEDIYLWSSQNSGDNGQSGFELDKWREWKRGFETCSNSDRLHPQAKGQAERAYSRMKALETAGTCH